MDRINNLNLFFQKNTKSTFFVVLSLVLLWLLFLLQDMNFMWEDHTLYHLVEPMQFDDPSLKELTAGTFTNPDLPIAPPLITIMTNYLTNIKTTWTISQHNANLMPLYDLVPAICSGDLRCYRAISISLLLYLTLLILLFFKKMGNIMYGIFAVGAYVTFFQIWQQVAYSAVMPTLLMHAATASALFIFYFYYQNSSSLFKTSFLFFVIFSLVRFSILIKEEGRIVFFIMLLFFLVTDIRQLMKPKIVILLFFLFLISYPFAGGSFSFITQASDISGVIDFVYEILKQWNYLIYLYGVISSILILIIISTVIFCIIKKRYNGEPQVTLIFKSTLFSLIWFCSSIIIPFSARGFVYTVLKGNWNQIYFFYTLLPFVLFIFSGIYLFILVIPIKYKGLASNILFILIIISLFISLLELNRFVGAHRDYFIGLDTVREYVDSIDENAILVITSDSQSFQTLSLKNYIVLVDVEYINDTTLLKQIKGNYSRLYITERFPIKFSEQEQMSNVTILTPRINSVYAKLKMLLNRKNTAKFYFYKLKEGD